MIAAVRDSPESSRPSAAEVTDLSGIRFRYRICDGVLAMEGSGEVTPTPRPRGAGRPSKLAQYAPQIAQWLREDPAPSAIEILRRVRLAGYRGGKSALYELVRRVRTRRLDDQPEEARQLIIVAGNRGHLYKVFQRAFVGNETVRVLLDRRVAERRRQHSLPPDRERRQSNRRTPLMIDGLLRAIGWTIVRV